MGQDLVESRSQRRPRWRWAAFLASLVLLILILAGALSACASGSPFYLLKAARGQLQILCNRRPITEVLQETEDPKLKSKLELVLKVQEFSRQKLSLDTGDSFRYFSKIDRDAAAYNVVAAPALSLSPHTYWFPLVGSVPYLGFFSREEAEEHARSLEKAGLDVLVQDVAGYSTLGWFDDPLLSSQLAHSEYGLIRLVIHEAVHSTVWIPGSVAFNESLASFVEEKGSREFIAWQDPEGKRLQKIDDYKKERESYIQLMRATASELKTLYDSQESEQEKKDGKSAILADLRLQIRNREWKFLNPEKLLAKDYNNAHFLSYLTYHSGNHYFQGVWERCDRDWKCFLERMKELDAPPEGWNRAE